MLFKPSLVYNWNPTHVLICTIGYEATPCYSRAKGQFRERDLPVAMANKPARYLTVKEAAGRLRVARETVYRWLRAGKLTAVRVGKEWRIPLEALRPPDESLGLVALEGLLARLYEKPEHLLGLTGDKLALARMEAAFFQVASSQGARMVHARWDEDEATVRRRLRPIVRDNGDVLHMISSITAYEASGAEGVAELLLHETEQATADGKLCAIYGSSYAYFGPHLERLTTYECEMQEQLRGRPAFMLSSVAFDDFPPLYGGRTISMCAELMNCHAGAIWFDGERALLTRPAGR